MTIATDRGYVLQNAWDKERRRLALLEASLDPTTTARLIDLGVGPGWRVLEVGAGGGSIAHWLCDRVGESGRVTAVDLDPRFLRADPRPNLEIVTADVLADPIPGGDYDLVHVRALLMHLPEASRLLAALLGALRPGGVLLVEEGDSYPLETASSAGYVEVCRRSAEAVAARGGDWSWPRRLPEELLAAGAVEVGAACTTPMFNGGSALAEFWSLTIEQVKPLLGADAGAAEAFAAVERDLTDPAKWFPFLAMFCAWGRRPT
jgi:SAM-dependent methyltransferase